MRGYLPDGLFICIPIKASICPPVSETTLTWTGGPLEVEPTTVEPPDLLSGPPGVSPRPESGLSPQHEPHTTLDPKPKVHGFHPPECC